MRNPIRSQGYATGGQWDSGCTAIDRYTISIQTNPNLHIVLRQCPRRSFEARASCHLNIVVVTSTQMRLPRSQMGT